MSRKKAWLQKTIVFAALLGGCGGDAPSSNERVTTARAAATTAPSETPAAGSATPSATGPGLVADDGITFGEGVTVGGGSVRVRHRGDGASFDPPRIRIGKDARVHAETRIAGDSVWLGASSTAGAIQTNHLVDKGGTHGGVTPFVAAEAREAMKDTKPGTLPKRVESGTVELEPGAYGAVVVAEDATLRLKGGDYDVASVTVGRKGRIESLGLAVLRVAGDLKAEEKAFIGADKKRRINLRLEVGGSVNIGKKSEVAAVVQAKGTTTIGSQAELLGAIDAGSIAIGDGAQMSLLGDPLPEACGNFECDNHNPPHCVLVFQPAGTICNDSNKCTTGDVCDGAGHCEGESDLQDTNCVYDTCDPTTGIVTEHFVATGERCRNAPVCSGRQCKADHTCETAAEATLAPDGMKCGLNPVECEVQRTCHAGVCPTQQYLPKGARCESDDPCTEKACNTAHECKVKVSHGGPVAGCGGTACDTRTCVTGACTGTASGTCSGTDACTVGSCLPDGTCDLAPVEVNDNISETLDSCDPVTGAILHTPVGVIVDRGSATNFGDATAFLYTGPNAIQVADEETALEIDPLRAAVIRGVVRDTEGSGIVGATISVVDHPEFGSTLSQGSGRVDLAVSGGGLLTVRYEKQGYLTVHRQVEARWQEYSWLPDVRMTRIDPNANAIELDTNEVQHARGEAVEDGDGVRQATLIFPAGASTTVGHSDLTVHLTEFTVGSKGPLAMPAPLPPTTGYTYAVELSAMTAEGELEDVVFDPGKEPVFYVENFPGFAVGTPVPMGYYDRDEARWVAAPNGRVIEITAITGGVATVNTGMPAITLSLDERTKLGELYEGRVGATLWRAVVPHFSIWDLNWPASPPEGACKPSESSCQPDDPSPGGPDPDDSCESEGSTILCQPQVLGEEIPVAGTPFSLVYRSNRVKGRKEARTLTIPLVKNVPEEVQRIEARVEIAGRRIDLGTFDCPCDGLAPVKWSWDGLDVYGRELEGAQPITVDIGYVYKATYRGAAAANAAFALYSGNASAVIEGRRDLGEITLRKLWRGTVGAVTRRDAGLGGWSLSAHHTYDPAGHALHLGTGERRSLKGLQSTISTVLGGTSCTSTSIIECKPPELGVSCTTRDVCAGSPQGVAVAPDGTIYFADTQMDLVRKISPDGAVTRVAGMGSPTDACLSCPVVDGVPGTQSALRTPTDVALGPDGSLFILEFGGFRVRRIDPTTQLISTVVGTGMSCQTDMCGEGGPATAANIGAQGIAVGPDGALYLAALHRLFKVAQDNDGVSRIHLVAGGGPATDPNAAGNATSVYLKSPQRVAVGPDGSVFVTSSDAGPNRGLIRRLRPDGILETFAGVLTGGSTEDGTRASEATFRLNNNEGIAIRADGTMVFGAHDRFLTIDPNGVVARLAGTNTPCGGPGYSNYCGDNGPAKAATIVVPHGVAFAPDGSVILTINSNANRILRVRPALPRFSTDEIVVPSQDGGEIYVFDATGKHLRTEDRRMNLVPGSVPRYSFGYADPEGRLTTIADASGKVTTIDYTNGWIIGPFGDKTTFTLDANQYLQTVSNPNLETYLMCYGDGGLLTAFQDPAEHALETQTCGVLTSTKHVFTYDPDTGRLKQDDDPEGGQQKLSLSGTTVTRTTKGGTQSAPANYSTAYGLSVAASGIENRSTTIPGVSNTATTVIGTDGKRTVHLPDGMTIETALIADPEFGLLAATQSRTTTTPSGLVRQESTTRSFGASDMLIETFTLNGKAYTSVFDPATRMLTQTTAANRTSTLTFDLAGQVVASAAVKTGSTTFAHDLGRMIAATRAGAPDAAPEIPRATGWTYYTSGAMGVRGNAETVTDAAGMTTTFGSYDAAGRLLSATLPGAAGRTVGYGYDANGNTTAVKPPPITASAGGATLNPLHKFGFSEVNRLESYLATTVETPTIGAETFFANTRDRQLAAMLRPGEPGVGTQYTYANGRVMTAMLAGGQGTIMFGYEPATGRLGTLTGPSTGVSLAFGYDGSLMTSATWSGTAGVTGAVTRTFDADFRVATETAAGVAFAFGYDLDGLPTCEASGASVPANCNGGVSITRIAGTTLLDKVISPALATTPIMESYSQNGFGETTGYTAQRGATVLYQETYVRDALGRIRDRTEVIAGVTKKFRYGYGPEGRLQTVRSDFSDTAPLLAEYTYDLNGNRLRRVAGAEDEAGTFDVQDRMRTYGPWTFDYADSGELVSVTGGDVDAAYTYDAMGNLRTATVEGEPLITYLIDGKNRRVGKKVGSGGSAKLEKKWLYADDLRIAAEIELNPANGAVLHTLRFVYGSKGNAPDLMIRDGVRYRILSDHLGSPRLVVRESDGVVMQRMAYDEFGRVTEDTAEGFQPFGFAGGLYDPDTGLVRFGARDYDARVGRWTAKDPIRFEGGDSNLYGYVGNDPINLLDPTGTIVGVDDAAVLAVAAVVGALATAAAMGPKRLPNPREEKCRESRDQCELESVSCDDYRTTKKLDCLNCFLRCMSSANRLLPTALDLFSLGKLGHPWPDSPECGGGRFKR